MLTAHSKFGSSLITDSFIATSFLRTDMPSSFQLRRRPSLNHFKGHKHCRQSTGTHIAHQIIQQLHIHKLSRRKLGGIYSFLIYPAMTFDSSLSCSFRDHLPKHVCHRSVQIREVEKLSLRTNNQNTLNNAKRKLSLTVDIFQCGK